MADPIETRHHTLMNTLAHTLDEIFNGPPPPAPAVAGEITTIAAAKREALYGAGLKARPKPEGTA